MGLQEARGILKRIVDSRPGAGAGVTWQQYAPALAAVAAGLLAVDRHPVALAVANGIQIEKRGDRGDRLIVAIVDDHISASIIGPDDMFAVAAQVPLTAERASSAAVTSGIIDYRTGSAISIASVSSAPTQEKLNSFARGVQWVAASLLTFDLPNVIIYPEQIMPGKLRSAPASVRQALGQNGAVPTVPFS